MKAQKSKSGALAVAVGIFLSRIAGLLRERVLAHYLGNTEASGAFRAALRIPNLLQNLFGEGALSASFIPVYAKLNAEGKHEDAKTLASNIACILTCVVLILAASGYLAAGLLVDLFASGFEGETRELTIHFVRILFPGVGFLVLSAWCLGVLNSHRRFLLSYVAPVVWNFAIMLVILIGAKLHTDATTVQLAEFAAWGTVVGSFFQLAIQVPSAFKLSGLRRLRAQAKHEATREVIRNFGPALISRGVLQISAFIDQNIASLLGAPMVAALSYVQILYMLPISLFGMAISSAELPTMSSSTGSSEETASYLRKRLSANLQRITFFVVPSVVAFVLLGDIVVSTLFQTGRFEKNDVYMVWMILIGSSVGLTAATQSRLISAALWTLRDTKSTMKISLLRVGVAGLLGYLFAIPLRQYLGLADYWGAAALVAAGGIASWVEFGALRMKLQSRIGAFPIGMGFAAKVWLLALLSAGVVVGVKLLLPPFYPLLRGAILLGIYGVLYIGIATYLSLGEGLRFRSLIAKVLKRKS